mgnify:CR=1 FL=1
MTVADVPAVAGIERAGYAFPWSERVFRDCLRSGYPSWLLLDAGVPAAHLIVSMAAGEAHVLNLCVHPRCQGRGLGRQLMAHGLDKAAEAGARVMFLEVRPSNAAARALYASLGFNAVGQRPDYYPTAGGGRETALVMSRALVPFSRVADCD